MLVPPFRCSVAPDYRTCLNALRARHVDHSPRRAVGTLDKFKRGPVEKFNCVAASYDHVIGSCRATASHLPQ